ncbi:hypothetical protein BKM17_03730 [Pseudomonas syringae group genomosp. 3]|nr:hypothetical protein BKM17_03730 [Pseudomonas syringae group genomosp. 3]
MIMNDENEKKVEINHSQQQPDKRYDSEVPNQEDQKETDFIAKQSQQSSEEIASSEAITLALQDERQHLLTWVKEYLKIEMEQVQIAPGNVETGDLRKASSNIETEQKQIVLSNIEKDLDEYTRSGGSILSGCPGGSASGGICRPFSNERRSTWMTTYTGSRHLRIMDSILPGTHQSGFDKQAPYGNSYETCQDVSPYAQLMTGIRVLDIRVEFKASATGAYRFSIFHSLNSGRTIDGDIIQAVIYFRGQAHNSGNPRREVIILDFHQFKNFTDAAHRELAQLLKSRMGGFIIAPWMSELTIEQIWEFGELGVVISYEDNRRDSLFWNGVKQKWIGHNFPSTDELKGFMDNIAATQKPYGELWAIQCAKYNKPPFGTPDDFSDKIRQWFYSDNIHSYIQNFFIINTDWSLRQRLIDNCIHANGIKTRNIAGYITYHLAQMEEFTLYYGWRSTIAYLADGYWAGTVRLPPTGYTNTGSTVVIKSNATYDSRIMLNNTNLPMESIPLKKGDVFAFVFNQGRWVMCGRTYLAAHGQPDLSTPMTNEKIIYYNLSDEHWSDSVKLPSQAADLTLLNINSTATRTSRVQGNNLKIRSDVLVPPGFSGFFIYCAETALWEPSESL